MARPPWPFTAKTSSPEYTGLVAWCPYPQAGTTVLHDLVGGTDLTLVNGAGPVTSGAGTALDCAANDRGARVTAPSTVRGVNPVTLVWIGTGAASPTAWSWIFGISHDDQHASPYEAAAIAWDSAGTRLYGGYTDSGGTHRTVTSTGTNTLDSGVHVIVLAIQNLETRLYLDGAEIGVSSDSFDGGGATSTALWSVGAYPTADLSLNSKTTCYDVRVYHRFWSAAEVTTAWNSGSPWDLYAPVGGHRSAFGARKPSRRLHGHR